MKISKKFREALLNVSTCKCIADTYISGYLATGVEENVFKSFFDSRFLQLSACILSYVYAGVSFYFYICSYGERL